MTLEIAFANTITSDQQTLDANKSRLAEIVRNLAFERKNLRKADEEKRSLLREIEEIDLKITDHRQNEERLRKRAEMIQEKHISMAEKRIREQKQKRMQQQEILAGHLRILYTLGKESLLKLLFSGKPPGEIVRGTRYFKYLLRARNLQLAGYRDTLQKLHQLIKEHQAWLHRVKVLTSEQQKERQASEQKRLKRALFLEKIDRQQRLRRRKLQELEQAKKDLHQFVNRLEKALTEALIGRVSFGHIANHRGALTRPLAGSAQKRSPGLFFPAHAQESVVAVFRGQVVYADWFRGYGLLLILDHGDHMYSLYGHNSRLLTVQGEWVEEGAPIAHAGDTGSLSDVGLYFELRQKGRSIDPEKWLKNL